MPGRDKASQHCFLFKETGGSFTAKVNKGWACDNGTDSETPADRVTIVGTPTTSSLTKKTVIIQF